MTGNDNEPRGVECEVVEVRGVPGEYLVEAIDHGSDGEIYRAIFQGPSALVRALAYAAEKYGHNGILMETPGPRERKPRPVLTVVAARPQAESGAGSPSEASASAPATDDPQKDPSP